MKRVLIVVAAVVVLLVAAGLVAPSFVDWNQYKGQIAGPIEEATGRKLAMNGDVSLAILPSPRVSAAEVVLSDRTGTRDFVRLRSLEVQVALWPLLRGDIQVVSVRLVEPEVFLEVAEDGTTNWQLGAAGEETSATSDAGANISVERVVVANGTVSYIDLAAQQRRTVEGITATLTAENLTSGPYAAEGRLTINGQPIGFDVSLGALDGARAVPLRGRFELERGGAQAALQGAVTSLSAAPALDAGLTFEGSDLREALSVIALAAGIDLPLVVPGAQSFAVTAQLSSDQTQAALNDLSIQIGDTRATGAVSASLGPPVSFDVTIGLGRLDLDAWANAVSFEVGEGDTPSTDAAGDANPLAALAGVHANIALTGEALTYRGSVVRQLRLTAGVQDGRLSLSNLSAMLPGGSDVSVSGEAATVEGQPRFDGAVEAASADLRALMAWLGVPLEGVAPDRLRQFSLQSRLRVTPTLGQVFGIDLRLDSSRVTGGAAYAFRTRPSFSVDLEVDRLNVDAYLPASADGETGTAEEPGATGGIEAGALAFLDTFDTNTKLAVRALTFQRRQFGDVRLDATLLAGNLTLREASFGDIGGASLNLSGTAGAFASVPAFDTRLALQADDLAVPARFFGVDLPVDVRSLGAAAVNGSLIGTAEDLALDLTASVGDLVAGLAGRVELIAAAPRFDLQTTLTGPSFVRAAQLAGLSIQPSRAALDGPLSVSGTVRGDAGAINIDTDAKAADLSLVIGGTVSDPLQAPRYNLALQLNHPNLETMLQMAGTDYRPAAVNLGAVRMLADVAGSPARVNVSRIEGALGPVNFVGDAEVALDRTRPRIDARLNTSEVLVDLFLPRTGAAEATAGAGGGAAAPAAADGARWSQEPIDLSALRGFDGSLELRARGLTYGSYALREPVLVAALDDGTLTVDPLAANLFGGEAAIRMTAVADRRARIGLSLGLDGADIEQALRAGAGLDRVTGAFDMSGQVTTVGRSQFELVRNLGGTLSFQARDGLVRGVDLASLSARLGELNRGLDFADLLVRTLQGGQTNYQSITGNFQIENGVARSDDLQATLDAATGAGTAVIDLPRWRLDMKTRARLTEHPNSPDVGLDLVGPLDNPQRNLRTRELEQYIAARVGSTLIRKLLDDDDDAAPATPAPAAQQNQDSRIPALPGQSQGAEEEQAPATGSDVIRGIFRRLGDR